MPDAPRARPPDRREQILAAAMERFRRFGSPNVSMANVAADVGIGPSALYRHVRNKEDLLGEVLRAALDRIARAMTHAITLDDHLVGLAHVATTMRDLRVLWEREAANLAEDAREEIRDGLDALRDRLRGVLDLEGNGAPPGTTDLRCRAMLSVFSVGTRHAGQALVDAERLLRAAARQAGTAMLTPDEQRPAPPTWSDTALGPTSRHEAILGAATYLFGQRDYPAVTLDAIGAAAGIAGPSIYNHFDSKAELLERVVTRINELLWMDIHSALHTNDEAPGAIETLLCSYVEYALTNPGLVGTMVNQLVHIPPLKQDRLRRVQHAYIDEWAHLQALARPELDRGHALVLSLAATTLVNTLVRVPEVRARPAIHSELVSLGRAVLDTPVLVSPSPSRAAS